MIYEGLEILSKFSVYLLGVLFLCVVYFLLKLLLELQKFSKRVDDTMVHLESVEGKVNAMQTGLELSTSEAELFNVYSYADLKFKSDLVSTAVNFTIDNSDEISKWGHKIVSGYKKRKKKRRK